MFKNAFNDFSENCESMFSPLNKCNEIVSKNVSDLIQFQVSALTSYSNIALASLKALGEVKDLTSLTQFNSKQMENGTKVSKQCTEDYKKINEIANTLKSDVESLSAEFTKTKAAK